MSQEQFRLLRSFVLGIILPVFFSLPSAALAAVTFTPAANPAVQELSYGTQTAIFSNVNIGTPSADRVVVVGLSDDNTCSSASLSIGGTSATEAVQSSDGNSDNSSLWYAATSSGTTANITATCSAGAFDLVDILVETITGAASAAPTATAITYPNYSADPQQIPTSTPITIPANGGAVILGTVALGVNNTITWTNTSNTGGDYYNATSTGNNMSIFLAHSYSAGSETYSVAGSVGNGLGYSGFSGVVAAWAPALTAPTIGRIIRLIGGVRLRGGVRLE